MSSVTRATTEGRAYLDLQYKARKDGRATDELIVLYALEGFLARLAESTHVESLVLKGGVLLAAFGDRRPTRDVDLAGIDIDNDAAHILGVVQTVASTRPAVADGLAFDSSSAEAEVIRDSDAYSGVRVSMRVGLARATAKFHVDVSVGDPIWPAHQDVLVPRLLDGPAIEVRGYPMEMALAEKIVTAVQRGTANTRWRDFSDIWTLSSKHTLDGSGLQEAIARVAEHRAADLTSLEVALIGYADLAHAKWAQWRRKLRLDELPVEFGEVLHGCVEFADTALLGAAAGLSWDPVTRSWS